MPPMTEDQNRLRTTFDGAALLYDQVRPGYPEELFDDMVALSGLPPGGRVLEIGCGTGQATVPSPAVATASYASSSARTWPPSPGATWCPTRGPRCKPGTSRSTRCRRGLRPGRLGHRLPLAGAGRRLPESGPRAPAWGGIALFWNEHVHSDASGGFFEAAQEVYEREAPEIVKPDDHKGLLRPEDLPDRTEGIEASGLFAGVVRRDYRWDQPYDAGGYVRVLIEREYDGRIVKGYLTTLYLAYRK
jgi:hypothetical protein